MKAVFPAVVLWSTVLVGVPGLARDATQGSRVADLGFCKPYTWLFGGWVAPPRTPLLGDVNGDGYADFVYASPRDRIIDVSLNGRGWKPIRGQRLLSGLPQEITAMCAAHLGGTTTDLAVLGKQGGLLKALSTGSGSFPKWETIGSVAAPAGKAWLLAGKVRSTVTDDLIVVDAAGRVEVLDASGKVLTQIDLGARVVDAAAGDVDGDGRAELATRVGSSVSVWRLGDTLVRIAAIRAPKGQEALAIGDCDGDRRADLLVNGVVFTAPDFRRSVPVPGWSAFRRPVVAMMADVVGYGRADVVVQHKGPDYYGSTEADCDLYVSYGKADQDFDRDGLTNEEEASLLTDPLSRDTDIDGLPDGWEVHGFAGMDLLGLGCSPRRKDVLVMNMPYDHVPIDHMEKYMAEHVAPFFAKLPYTNVDGTKGFAIHAITQRPPFAAKGNEGKGWQQVAGDTFPQDRIGLYHWMLVSGMGGGGQSGQLADAGSTGMGSWTHEFGHQLGLSHTGKWGTWSPTYTSLMNYSYSYQFEGDGKKVHFSTGDLAGLVLNEARLPGKVRFPIEKLRFLAGPPYRLHLKSAGKDSTYIDWGWTGVFVDRKVRANITYGYGVGAGERLQPSGTQTFNYDGPYELMTDYQASLAEHRGTMYMVTASRAPLDPAAPRPESATLVMQTHIGKHAWTKPVTIAPKVTNDPFTVSDARHLYVFYPTAEGVMLRFGRPEALGAPHLIPETKGASVSAVNWKGAVLLFLYYGPDKSVVYRTVHGAAIGPVVDLKVKSTIPPGPAVDTIHDQLLLGTAGLIQKQPYRWQLRRFAWDKKNGAFSEVSCVVVGGEKAGWAGNRRPTLIFSPGREYGPDGRVYFIAAGMAQPLTTPTGFYVAQTIAYKDMNDGWLLWRYYDEWTNTRSGIGAAWSTRAKDITIATTWASGTAGGDCGVFVAYNGTAIGNTDMGDFDDISLMANYGIARSIGTFAKMPTVGPR